MLLQNTPDLKLIHSFVTCAAGQLSIVMHFHYFMDELIDRINWLIETLIVGVCICASCCALLVKESDCISLIGGDRSSHLSVLL